MKWCELVSEYWRSLDYGDVLLHWGIVGGISGRYDYLWKSFGARMDA